MRAAPARPSAEETALPQPTDPAPHAVLTGASSGIGEAILHRLLRDGWRVTALSRRPPAIEHPALTHRPADLGDATALRAAAEGLRADAFIHAAGLMATAPLGELQAEAGASMWQLHVQAPSLLADLLLPGMGEGGRIVLLGSRTANGAAGRSQYAASKSALTGLSRSWAAELAPRGITVNVVAPAATDTPMLRDPARASVAPRLPPIGRLIRPEEVAATVAFLLAPEAAAITGQTIVICGGSSL
ncbi:oxidoreductase, short chain dehydrogenase/reductase family protein [Pseudoroseomonas cervicalis ATCC 49957]|uniref:Oxidoreductase, short chain dehydrogenase/reductase family protein n=1 Tax=Pseudoroseomonas cervicalis ATCC 49957 TaxID=525371 RepID=D5RN59_9PROT|nr:oxidoreductase, short chain dehydrogenase/reductase family protein [Pseudoroseomonas cervicalis ATCC 49957]